MALTYVSPDGSYGSAEGLVIVDTSKWTDSDWNQLEWAMDENMPKVAMEITEKYKEEQ